MDEIGLVSGSLASIPLATRQQYESEMFLTKGLDPGESKPCPDKLRTGLIAKILSGLVLPVAQSK